MAWDLHLLAHALAQAPGQRAEGVEQLLRAWQQQPSQRARLGAALVLAARDQYGLNTVS